MYYQHHVLFKCQILISLLYELWLINIKFKASISNGRPKMIHDKMSPSWNRANTPLHCGLYFFLLLSFLFLFYLQFNRIRCNVRYCARALALSTESADLGLPSRIEVTARVCANDLWQGLLHTHKCTCAHMQKHSILTNRINAKRVVFSFHFCSCFGFILSCAINIQQDVVLYLLRGVTVIYKILLHCAISNAAPL